MATLRACPTTPSMLFYLDDWISRSQINLIAREIEKYESCNSFILARLMGVNVEYSKGIKHRVAEFISPGPIPDEELVEKLRLFISSGPSQYE